MNKWLAWVLKAIDEELELKVTKKKLLRDVSFSGQYHLQRWLDPHCLTKDEDEKLLNSLTLKR